MRRLFILLLSLTILFGHAFASDCHISLQCSFPAHTDSRDIPGQRRTALPGNFMQIFVVFGLAGSRRE